MNSDAVKSTIVKLLLMAITPLATKFHLDDNIVPAVAADLADLAVLAWGIYSHWGMKKVPTDAKVTTK